MPLFVLLKCSARQQHKMAPEFRESNGEIPWRDIIAMRDRLIHAYFDINYAVVWRTVKEDLPQFIKLLKRILEQ